MHRISLTVKDLDTFNPRKGKSVVITLIAEPERDSRNEVMGLRLSDRNGAGQLRTLGLQRGDLLTAVGMKRLTKVPELAMLFEPVRRGQETSLTLERERKPHKIFYTLAEKQS